jgi:hypothetical protein
MPSPNSALSRIAIDGRPASPAMAAALEAIDRNVRIRRDRLEAIAADPRIRARQAARTANDRDYLDGMDGAFLLMADLAAGRIARRGMFNALLRARIALVDKNYVEARRQVRLALFARREAEAVAVVTVEPGFVSVRTAVPLVAASLSEAA